MESFFPGAFRPNKVQFIFDHPTPATKTSKGVLVTVVRNLVFARKFSSYPGICWGKTIIRG